MRSEPNGASTHVVLSDDPSTWVETSVRTWEAALHREGWNQPPSLALMIAAPSNGGMAIAHLNVPRELMEPPHQYLAILANQSAAKLRRRLASPEWSRQGWSVVGVLLALECWSIETTSANLGILFRGESWLSEHPNRIEERRVLVVGSRPGREYTLSRTRGQLEASIEPGIQPEHHRSAPRTPDFQLRDSLRAIARKLASRG